jgi:hypothetical protein
MGAVPGVPAKDEKKYASSHDFQRRCAERPTDAGVPEREVSRTLRHASVETPRKHYARGVSAIFGRDHPGQPECTWVRPIPRIDVTSVHPRGFEPLTFGSVDRCSIQLS